MKKIVSLNIQSLIGQVNYIVLPDGINREELQRQTQQIESDLCQALLAMVVRATTTAAEDIGEAAQTNNSQQ